MNKRPVDAKAVRLTANEDFKRSSSVWFWGSISAATVVHFLVFALWPSMFAPDVSLSADEIPMVELPPEVEIPPPPEEIARPATPVITDSPIDEEVTIPDVTFQENPVENLPPPPDGSITDSDVPIWVPRDVDPDFKDGRARQAMINCLERAYPPLLRDAGIGGEVLIWAYVDETGDVLKSQVNKSSGHPAFDEVAVREIRTCPGAEFSPGMFREKPTALWVALPISFNPK